MLQDKATSEANYNRFVERVKQSKEVWGLKSDNGWAYCPSNEQEGADVLVFWSDRAYAARQAKEEWSDYRPELIALDDFIDLWLRGMHEDGSLVGPNWDANMCGLEVEPREIARRLTDV